MANQEKAVPALPPANALFSAATDTLVAVVNGNTSLVPVSVVQAVNTSLGTPANSTSAVVTQGTAWTDGTYFYLATANNSVKRVLLSAF
jgi:hypothetical protein